MRFFYSFVILTFLLVFNACSITANINVIDSRTALENQILGAYAALDEELQLATSVRGIDPTGKIKEVEPETPEKEKTLNAVRTRLFFRDDLKNLKAIAWVGEKRNGTIKVLSYSRESVPEDYEEFASRIKDEEIKDLVKQLNDARAVTWQRIIDTSENLSKKDLADIQAAFGKLNYDKAQKGEMLEQKDGTFSAKK